MNEVQMINFEITCCSPCDMSQDFLNKNNVKCLPFTYSFNGLSYIDDMQTGDSLASFFQQMRDGKILPITSQASVGAYFDFFEKLLAQDKDVLHIMLSSGITGTANSARLAVEELKKLFPHRKIYLVDSLCASSGIGLLIDSLCQCRANGMSIEETKDWAESHKKNVQHWFFSSDLTHFKRGGRISAVAANFGSILNICPLMTVTNTGKLAPKIKVMGKAKAIKATVEKMLETAENGANYSKKCFISHSDCLKDAQKLATQIEKSFPNLDGKPQIFNIGKIIGSHTGPDAVTMEFWGSERLD